MVDQILFWIFATLAVIGALGVVTNKSLLKSALLLLVVFLSNAAFFVLNNADFLAIAQILVYAVGLTIVFLFAVMFTGDKDLFSEAGVAGKKASQPLAMKLMMLIITAYAGVLLLNAVAYPFRNVVLSPDSVMWQALVSEGSTRTLGQLLFTRFSLPFELASILLTVAMIGAIVLSKKNFDTKQESVKYALDLDSNPTDEALQEYLASPTRPNVKSEASYVMAQARKDLPGQPDLEKPSEEITLH